MLHIKAWLKTTGMNVAEQCFLQPPALPYIVFVEENDISGADSKNCIADRAITIELYSDRINREVEGKVETLLNEKEIQYKKERTWVDSERFFQTMYDFNLKEKF